MIWYLRLNEPPQDVADILESDGTGNTWPREVLGISSHDVIMMQ